MNLIRIMRSLWSGYQSLEDPRTPLSADDDGDEGNILSRNTASNVRITAENALSIPAVWRGVNLVSRDAAKLGLQIFKRNGAGKERATEHPAYNLVRYKPNPEQTAFVFWQTMFAWSLVRGNAYAYINRDGDARPVSLILLDPRDTYPIRVNGNLWYINGDQPRPLLPTNVLHLKGLGSDGLVGYSVWHKLREALGLAVAQEEYASRFFRNAATPAMVIEVPQVLTPESYNRLQASWQKAAQGLGNAHKTRILEQGAKANKVSSSPQETQLLEGRAFSLIDIANVLNLPAHKLGHQGRAGYASLEQENQSYLDDGLDPLLVNSEQEVRDKLLTEAEKEADSHVVEFNRAALVRANMATRASYFRTATAGRPWMSPDEVRAIENMNPRGGTSDEILEPLNMGNAGGADNAPNDPTAPEPGGQIAADRSSLAPTLRKLAVKTAARMAKRLAVQAQRAERKNALADWKARAELDNLETITDALSDLAEAAGELTGRQHDAAAHARQLILRFCAAEKPDAAELAEQTATDLLAAA